MIIPIVHCFNNAYVIPASVAFLSMLEHANSNHYYKLYVLHADITEDNQRKLATIVAQFRNATLEFIDMNTQFNELFRHTRHQGHYSKEMYYKLCVASLFPQYEFAIVTDVDVLYQGDISIEYEKFIHTTDYYMAGVHLGLKGKGTFLDDFFANYESKFSQDEKEILKEGVGAGYLIFNLSKIRRDRLEQKLIDCSARNAHRLIQPEQDTLNLCCFPHIYRLPFASMVCTYLYNIQSQSPEVITPEIKRACMNPVQIHFATPIKPWNTPTSTKAHLWYAYLLKTSFFYEQMRILDSFKNDWKEKWCLWGIPILSLKGRTNAIRKARLLGIKLKKK